MQINKSMNDFVKNDCHDIFCTVYKSINQPMDL